MAGKYLVTGVAGSGKSTLETIFREKGFETEDIDKGFAEWHDKTTGEVAEYQPDNPEWHDKVTWALRVDKLRERLDSVTLDPIFIFGSTTDMHEHVGLFDKVFLLEYPDAETIKHRLVTRPGDEYGKVPHEQEAVLWYYKDYQEQMKQLGAIAIDCTLPIDEVERIIENEVSRVTEQAS